MKYIEILAGIKFWTFIILVAIFFGVVLLCICYLIIQGIRERRKINLLKSYGCERYVSGVPSVGGGAFYSWKTADYKINIDERDIERITYSRLKEMLENKN